ncbi:phosphoenolpyruvate--protein phosphotransferase [Thermococcus paralvinellae]|uniref:Phosphoenolpyruvate-protein phosphotransferase n=1 Tax=Thermococcus paralvinellae TaxID=582419 RepID=W0I242_9EURY|nr:phosphoenolpyruvate--protein phosphotransferase [Thermococcus paralvinellae]AHF80084.1 putative phosphoenolpyruvate-protein phosphotransferase [Thermococcus paralvinellae]
MTKEVILRGIAASWGIGIGNAIVVKVQSYKNTPQLRDNPIKALEKTKERTLNMINELISEVTPEVAEILRAHKLMVEAIIEEALELVKAGKAPEEAITIVTDKYIELLKNSGSAVIQLRSDDLVDIKNTLLQNLLEGEDFNIKENSVVVAKEIYPSQLIKYSKKGVVGVVTEKGSYTSHAAIIARNLKIPIVFGIKDATKIINDGNLVIVDGFSGNLIVNPCESTIKKYIKRKEIFRGLFKKFEDGKDEIAETKDGRKILVMANVGNEDDLNTALLNGCDGVGLFRLEFYFMNTNSLPSPQELAQIFEKFAKKLEGKPLTLRLLDIGGDKEIPYLEIPKEHNPFLGLRGIRYLLKHEKLLKNQLEAIKLVKYKNMKIMVPMVSTVEEIRELKKIIEKDKGDKKIGIMAEVPSIVFMADKIMKEIDFISIGTNDLTQYIFAVDRTNEDVSYLYDDMHPAVLRAIAMLTKEAQRANVPVEVCGELAGNPLAVPILIGLGITELSVSPTLIPMIKWIIQRLSYREAKELVKRVLELENGEEVREEVRKFFKNILKIELPW